MMVHEKQYTDDELTAWLNGEFKSASSKKLQRSISLDNDLRDRVSSLASDISAVQTSPVPDSEMREMASGKQAAKLAIVVIAVALLWLLFS